VLFRSLKQNEPNIFQIIPTGVVYFLSNQSGTIDLVSTNYDGSNRQTVVTDVSGGSSTGGLQMTSDNKFAAINYLTNQNYTSVVKIVDIASGKVLLSTNAKVDTYFSGWAGHTAVFQSYDSTLDYGSADRRLITSYNADNGVSKTLFSNARQDLNSGYAFEDSSAPTIVGGKVVYYVSWTVQAWNDDDQAALQNRLLSVSPNGNNLTTLRKWSISAGTWLDIRVSKPNQAVIRVNESNNKVSFLTLTGDTLANADASMLRDYPKYYISPDGKQAIWNENRDGRNAIFLGGSDGNNAKQVAISDYAVYGWASDGVTILQKDSTLVVTTPDQLEKGVEPLTVGNFYQVTR
jgi:hypothetical protein